MRLSPPRTTTRLLALLLAAGIVCGACAVCAVVIVARAVASGAGHYLRHKEAAEHP